MRRNVAALVTAIPHPSIPQAAFLLHAGAPSGDCPRQLDDSCFPSYHDLQIDSIHRRHIVIRKAVIPVAGWGTRVLPATKALPKPLLPVADLPTIHYVVEEALAAGIDHIILVTNRHMRAVEDYFDENPELTRILEAKQNTKLLDRLKHIETM